MSLRHDMGPLGFGGGGIGNLYAPLTDEQAHEAVTAAWRQGVRYFDTAPHYGLGLSERRLGAFLATKPREEFVLSTKLGRRLEPQPGGGGTLDLAHDFVVPADQRRVWDFTAAGLRRGLEESLARLGLDSVDIVYLHDPERYDLDRALGEGLPAVADLRADGLVRAVGVGSMVNEALLRSARSGVVDVLMVAGRHTLLDHSADREVLPACREHDVAVVAAAVFNSGLTASPEPAADALFDYRPVDADLLERTRQIAEVCRAHGVDLPTVALQYPLRAAEVRSVVAGGASPTQVRENAARMSVEVPEALWQELGEHGLVAA